MAAHIIEFIAENSAGYFTAHIDNGGVRIGLRGFECFDFPPLHEDFARVVSLAENEIEHAYDEFVGRYARA